jgi:signal transduction histidine kinase
MLASELRPVAASSGHVLQTEIDDSVWCAGDDARILQVGRALATNSITHTPGGTTVTLGARRRGARAELVVEDDGPGIPIGQREAVFGRFYRVEGGMASGSGLGLSIGRELARLMGGDVTLESAARPTRFVLDLPGEPVPDGAVFSRENAARRRERVPGS